MFQVLISKGILEVVWKWRTKMHSIMDTTFVTVGG
jgi:hypothetical protein